MCARVVMSARADWLDSAARRLGPATQPGLAMVIVPVGLVSPLGRCVIASRQSATGSSASAGPGRVLLGKLGHNSWRGLWPQSGSRERPHGAPMIASGPAVIKGARCWHLQPPPASCWHFEAY